MARKYRVRMGAFDIGEWELQEVEALARRYPAMKRRADVLEKCHATGVHGEAYTAIQWECSIVDEALRTTGGGEWAKALEMSCCHGVPYADIDPADMPTSNKNDFARARREFYWRLWTLRQKKLGCAVKGKMSLVNLMEECKHVANELITEDAKRAFAMRVKEIQQRAEMESNTL